MIEQRLNLLTNDHVSKFTRVRDFINYHIKHENMHTFYSFYLSYKYEYENNYKVSRGDKSESSTKTNLRAWEDTDRILLSLSSKLMDRDNTLESNLDITEFNKEEKELMLLTLDLYEEHMQKFFTDNPKVYLRPWDDPKAINPKTGQYDGSRATANDMASPITPYMYKEFIEKNIPELVVDAGKDSKDVSNPSLRIMAMRHIRDNEPGGRD